MGSRPRGLLLALALVLVCPSIGRAEPIGLSDFLTRTTDLSKRIATVDAARARDVAASLPATWEVRHDAQDYRIDTDWVTGPLRQAAARPAEWAQTRSAL